MTVRRIAILAVIASAASMPACGGDKGSGTSTVTEHGSAQAVAENGRAADPHALSMCLERRGFTAVRLATHPTGVAATSPAGSKLYAATERDPLLAQALVRKYQNRKPPPTIGAELAPDGLTAIIVTPRDDEGLRLALQCLPEAGGAAPIEQATTLEQPTRPDEADENHAAIRGGISAATLFELRRNSVALRLDVEGLQCLKGNPTLSTTCDGYSQASTCVGHARSDQEIVECVAHGEFAVAHGRCLGEAVDTGGSIGACDRVARRAEEQVLQRGEIASSQVFALSEEEAVERGFNQAIGSHFGGFGHVDCALESVTAYACSGRATSGGGVWTAELEPDGSVIYVPR